MTSTLPTRNGDPSRAPLLSRTWPRVALALLALTALVALRVAAEETAGAPDESEDGKAVSAALPAAGTGLPQTNDPGHPTSTGETSAQHPPQGHNGRTESRDSYLPSVASALPFVTLLMMIALMPLIPNFAYWWENNWNRLLAAGVLGGVTCLYYLLRGHGYHHADPGLPSVLQVLDHAILVDYIPFIVLLFSLFTISGGIYIGGDIPAHPLTNVIVLLVGALLASFIGTTGASMLLIRPLLQINIERKYVTHSVVFFIFLVSNVGGCLLPIGDPPLFLGYLRGVPFLWTFELMDVWFFCVVTLLAVYWLIDRWYYKRETFEDIQRDEHRPRLFEIRGKINFVLLLGVIAVVALMVPGKILPGTSWTIPDLYLREFLLLGLAAASMLITSKEIREANAFSFYAIGEVAALFIGIFITMQAPVEILNIKGPDLGLTSPAQFFWATGVLSSFLDNAPTYVVFFQTAGTLPASGAEVLQGVSTATGQIAVPLLTAVSLGAVFMGACTYIGNGPNFMVKSIAENYEVRMPSFFGYMGYSFVFLFPVFALITWVFLV